MVDSIGVSIWQMAVEPCNNSQLNHKQLPTQYENGHVNDRNSESSDSESSESEDDAESIELHEDHASDDIRIAFACDDGLVRIYSVNDDKSFTYRRSLPRVSGETTTPNRQSTDFYCCFGSFRVAYLFLFRADIECHLEF